METDCLRTYITSLSCRQLLMKIRKISSTRSFQSRNTKESPSSLSANQKLAISAESGMIRSRASRLGTDEILLQIIVSDAYPSSLTKIARMGLTRVAR